MNASLEKWSGLQKNNKESKITKKADPRDVHNTRLKYKSRLRNLEANKNILEVNKKRITQFLKFRKTKEDLAETTLYKNLVLLCQIAQHEVFRNVRFDKVKEEQIEAFKDDIDTREKNFKNVEGKLSERTKQSFKVMLKVFFRWLDWQQRVEKAKRTGEEKPRFTKDYPRIISWINTTIPRKKRKKNGTKEVLTFDEIKNIVRIAAHTRDKALVSMLFECGARIGEFLPLQVKNIELPKNNQDAAFVHLVPGKTGERDQPIPLSFSNKYIREWLDQHPQRGSENFDEAFLWVPLKGQSSKPLKYKTFKKTIYRLTDKLGIPREKVHPHAWRAASATKDARDGRSQWWLMAKYGWDDPRSAMSYIQKRQLMDKEDNEPTPTTQTCFECGTKSPVTESFCPQCHTILDLELALKMKKEDISKRKKIDDFVGMLMGDPIMKKRAFALARQNPKKAFEALKP